ncbi:DUF6519 domain-containing protein [Kitasatospora sp. NPDC056327]|uniref:DUF6519 domain-containing protein n=2 Tax=unclassified Kitasatospora TaxID=2633591 RepID=UPI0035DE82CE
MHADFSRLTFRPGKHYSAVLTQQGRVQLDADANEQAAIERYQLRTLAADLIGRRGGPAAAAGFAIGHLPGAHDLDDLTIGGGRYYVDGILCEAFRPEPGSAAPDDDAPDGGHCDGAPGGTGPGGDGDGRQLPAVWTYWDQPDAYRDQDRPGDRLPGTFPFLVYLKVWERSVTAVEDPEIREVALGAAMPDTAARARVVWQVLALPGAELSTSDSRPADTGGPDGTAAGATDGGTAADGGTARVRAAFDAWAEPRERPAGRLAARARRPGRASEDPCLASPEAAYRGPENQLYRVEVHRGGPAGEGATFKWSRENGSVVLPVVSVEGVWVGLTSLGDDDGLALSVGDWVEAGDSAYVSRNEPADLLRVEETDLPGRRVRLSAEPVPEVGRLGERRPFLRRWDHRAPLGRDALPLSGGALRLREGVWLDLEDGVQVYFRPDGRYTRGDYWLVPARTATGSVEWPRGAAGEALFQAPAGVRVHHAPLAWVTGPGTAVDLRQTFGPLAAPTPHGG